MSRSVTTSYKFNSRASAPACSMIREKVSHDSADVPLRDPITGMFTAVFA